MADAIHEDDPRVRAMKELAVLAERPGYAEAIAGPPVRDRRPARLACVVAAALSGLLAVACAVEVSAWWLRVGLPALFVALACLFALAAVGFARDRPDLLWPIAILDKRARDDGSILRIVRADGTELELDALDAVAEALKAGDVGVARVTDGVVRFLVGFVRL